MQVSAARVLIQRSASDNLNICHISTTGPGPSFLKFSGYPFIVRGPKISYKKVYGNHQSP